MSRPQDTQVRDIFAPSFYSDQPNVQRYSEAPIVSPERALVDYPRARRETILEPISAFAPPGTAQIAAPRVLKLDLSIVRANVAFELSGNVLWYQRSTNISDLISVRYGSQDADAVEWQPGNALGGIPFDRLFITNAAIAGAFGSLLVFGIPDQKLFLL